MGFWDDTGGGATLPAMPDFSPTYSGVQQVPGGQTMDFGLPWVDQFAQHILLTAQAFQRLHTAWDGKFTR